MVKYIQLGEYNKHYIYILLTTFFHFTSDILIQVNGLFNEKINNLRYHEIIHDFYFQIIISVISFILYKKSFQSQSNTIDESKHS